MQKTDVDTNTYTHTQTNTHSHTDERKPYYRWLKSGYFSVT